jgi:hypothetical protein
LLAGDKRTRLNIERAGDNLLVALNSAFENLHDTVVGLLRGCRSKRRRNESATSIVVG